MLDEAAAIMTTGMEQRLTQKRSAGADSLIGALLEQLAVLGSEMELGMASVAQNQVTTFERSVERQESLCAALKRLLLEIGQSQKPDQSAASRYADGLPDRLRPESEDEAADAAEADRVLRARLGEATRHMQALNHQYATLLQHSGQSISLLSALCSTYAGKDQLKGSRAKHQTWSCEV